MGILSQLPTLPKTIGRSVQVHSFAVELLAALAFGLLLLHLAYGATPRSANEIGLPGHDSFYHVKMAVLLPEVGLVDEFPWLRFCYFRDEGQAFVSHHVGFHFLLVPFVKLAEYWLGDPLAGGRWATMACFGIVVMLFHLLLIHIAVPWRWVWLILFVLMPYQFFFRHTLVRAISPSLALMLLLVWALMRRRAIFTSLICAAYVHLYLGGAIFAPLLVALHTLALAVGPKPERCIPWKLALGGFAGWFIGMLTYPYAGGSLEFLRLQVFGSGLTPDISVGQEWNSYENVWWFTRMSGTLFLVWAAAVAVRLRAGPAIRGEELSLLLMSLAFLALTLKARRFVEYWPVLTLLSAAGLATPSLNGWRAVRRWRPAMLAGGLVIGWGTAAVLAAYGLYYFNPLASSLVLSAHLLGLFMLLGAIAWLGRDRELLRLPYAEMPVSGTYLPESSGEPVPASLCAERPARTWLSAGRAAGFFLAAVLGGAILAVPGWGFIRRDARCQFDLPAIRAMMDFVKSDSQPGDIIFTDDWDVFPVFFFYNSHNHYIVGLDPKFTHHRRPDLWERYVHISRGQVPTDSTVSVKDERGATVRQTIHSRLEDIRDHFGARYVITDRDHEALASKLASAPHLAELVYPSRGDQESREAPYRVFRIRNKGPLSARETGTTPEAMQDGVLYLSALPPLSVQQGWGEFQRDQSVGGGPICMGDRVYARGLGTHAPSKIEYRIPDGFDTFEAAVGVNRSTVGRGSFVAVILLDGNEVVRSQPLRGDGLPFEVRVLLGKAKRLILRADPTSDGNRFDHVDWADARLVRSPRGTPGDE